MNRQEKLKKKNIEGSGNHQLQTQPTHSSWDGADRANQYGGMQLLPCFVLYALTLVQRDPVHSPAHCTNPESWNESHVPLPDGQE